MMPHRAALALGLAFGLGFALASTLRGTHANAAPEPDAATAIRVTDAKVELFVHDVEASIDFYATLGFAVAHRKPADDYTTLRGGGRVIALSPLPGWLPVHWLGFLRHPPLGTELVFYTEDLEASRTAFLERDLDPGDIQLRPWGDRDFRLTDPDGYYVRVSLGNAIPAGAEGP